MITVDQPKLEKDIAAFNTQFKARMGLLKQRCPVIVKRQAGLLARTLINLTPPRNKAKLEKKINDRVTSKFHTLGDDKTSQVYSDQGSEKAGHGSIKWYAFGHTGIYGIAKDADLTNASQDLLYKLLWRKMTKSGRTVAGKRGKQTIYVWQKITTKAASVKQLADRIIGHIGRMKAGWTVGWEECGKPGRALPKWVEKHAGKGKGARGYAVDGLGVPGAPQFIIANYAKGVNAAKAEDYMRAALRIRTQAMEKDTAFALQHPDKWSEREARADAAAEGNAIAA
jgi:hypothetical protein